MKLKPSGTGCPQSPSALHGSRVSGGPWWRQAHPPRTGAETLCVATCLEGKGAVAVQMEVSHFARQDARFRRFCAWNLRLGLLWTVTTLKDQSTLEASRRREERARGEVAAQAKAQAAGLEQLSFQLHDGAVQKIVAALHTVGALRTGIPDPEEQQTLLLRSEELLGQAVLELRSVINSLHTPPSPEGSG